MERALANLETQKQSTLEQTQEQDMIAEIVVSHGFFVDAMTKIFHPTHYTYCDYCAITSYKIKQLENDKDQVLVELMLQSDNDHINENP